MLKRLAYDREAGLLSPVVSVSGCCEQDRNSSDKQAEITNLVILKLDAENTSAWLIVQHFNFSMMKIADAFYDEQADAGSLGAPGILIAAAKELVKHLLLFRIRNANALIGYLEHGMIISVL